MAVNINAIKLAMVAKCYNVPQLAKVAGVKPLTVIKMLRGEGTPRMATMGKVAKALDVEPAQIVSFD